MLYGSGIAEKFEKTHGSIYHISFLLPVASVLWPDCLAILFPFGFLKRIQGSATRNVHGRLLIHPGHSAGGARLIRGAVRASQQ